MQEIEEERSQCFADLDKDNQTSGMGMLSSLPGLQANITQPHICLAHDVSYRYGCWSRAVTPTDVELSHWEGKK